MLGSGKLNDGSKIKACLNKAVNLQLSTETATGVFLSGGVFSSWIAAIAQTECEKRGLPPITTFTIGEKVTIFNYYYQ